MIWDVIIIGSGPAGLSAASSLKGLKVLLLEKQASVGDKLKLSGAGQCNLTHAGEMKNYENHYNKWRFVRYALMNYKNSDLINEMNSLGLETIVRDDNKVFPKSLKSQEVIDVLVNDIKGDIEINLNETVVSVSKESDFIVETEKATYNSKSVIVATGGISYPKTGSTGDAIRFAKKLHVDYETYRYALSPVYL